MPSVIRMASQYCKCPIDLLCQDQPGQLMRQRHGAKGQQALRPAAKTLNAHAAVVAQRLDALRLLTILAAGSTRSVEVLTMCCCFKQQQGSGVILDLAAEHAQHPTCT